MFPMTWMAREGDWVAWGSWQDHRGGGQLLQGQEPLQLQVYETIEG